jgi:hypothetical protein
LPLPEKQGVGSSILPLATNNIKFKMIKNLIKKIIPKTIKGKIKTIDINQKYLYGPHNKKFFKYQFEGVDKIQFNYSQSYQDLFVLTVLNGKTEGSYLEIGSGSPTYISNTYLLEQKYGWTGLGIEQNNKLANEHKKNRKNLVINTDALKFDYFELDNYLSVSTIDYLQIDIEPAENNLKVLKKIPFDKYEFNVITYETDIYVSSQNKNLAESARSYIKSFDYVLIKKDVKQNEKVYEDWYVNKKIIDDLTFPYLFEECINANEIFFKNLNSFQNASAIIKYYLKNFFR